MTTKHRKRKEPGLIPRYNFHFLRGGRRQHWWTYDKGKAELVKRRSLSLGLDFGITITEHLAKSLTGRQISLYSAED